MSDPATLPITEIESIGPQLAERLREVDVTVVADLYRVSTSRTQAAVADAASLEQVTAWREMAYLCQVRPVDGQFAEALRGAGVASFEGLSRAAFDELREAFADAHERGVIPHPPQDGQIADMMRDATVLAHTGHLSGRLVNGEGSPVAEAEVRLGAVAATTDGRGLFHLWRLPLHERAPLEVSTAGGERHVFPEPPMVRDPYRIEQWRASLQDAEPAPADAEPHALSELDGDELPIGPDTPTRVRHLPPGTLREGDVLLLREIDEGAAEASLVSRFRSWERGTLLVHPVRLPLDRLPPDSSEGAHFGVRAGRLRPLRVDARILWQLRAARRAGRAIQALGGDAPTDLQERLRAALAASEVK